MQASYEKTKRTKPHKSEFSDDPRKYQRDKSRRNRSGDYSEQRKYKRQELSSYDY